MKILMISSDRNILKDESESRLRMIEYGKLTKEMHIIVFNRKPDIANQNFGNIHLYPTNSLSRWFYIRDAIKIGKKILTSGGQWLISAQDPFECGLAGWRLKKRLDILLQLQIHTDFLSPYFKKGLLLNWFRVLIAKFLILRADCIRVVSERIKKSLLFTFHTLSSKIFVLSIFVDIEKIKKATVKTDLHKKYPQLDFIILMASRLTAEKNIGLAIEAMKKVVKIYPKTGLIIVGDGPKEKNLKACSSKIKANVIFESWTEDLASYYKTADLFLLTSNYEGYGRTVVEAMAGGCPVIMTNVGLAGEVLIDKKDGIIVPAGNKAKLIEAIFNLMEDSELRRRLVENNQKTMAFWPTRVEYLLKYRDSGIKA